MTAIAYEIDQPRWQRTCVAKEPYKRQSQGWTAGGSALASPRTVAVRPLWFRKSAEVPAKTKSFQLLLREKITRAHRQAQEVRVHAPISISLQRLLGLLAENGEDDHGVIDPTQSAFKTAFEFILNAEWKLRQDIKSAPVVDSEGGIRITWRSGNKQVKLICPATPNAPIYIYSSSPKGSYVLNQNVTFAALADRLTWLLHDDQSEQPSE